MTIDWITIEANGPPDTDDDILVVVEFQDGRREWDVGRLDRQCGWLLLIFADAVSAGDARITHWARVTVPVRQA